MQQSNVISVIIENASALQSIRQQQKNDIHYGAYLGMDVHKDTIAYAIALPDRASSVYRGKSPTPKRRLIG